MNNCFSTWFLNIVNSNLEIIDISNSNASGDVKLFETFTKMLNFLVWHLSIDFSTEGSSYEENLREDFGFFVKTSCIASG